MRSFSIFQNICSVEQLNFYIGRNADIIRLFSIV